MIMSKDKTIVHIIFQIFFASYELGETFTNSFQLKMKVETNHGKFRTENNRSDYKYVGGFTNSLRSKPFTAVKLICGLVPLCRRACLFHLLLQRQNRFDINRSLEVFKIGENNSEIPRFKLGYTLVT